MTALVGLPGVLIWCLLSNGARKPCDSTSVTEPSTGVAFPATLSALGPDARSGEAQTLLGVGVRKRTFLRIDVYVAGLYAPTRLASRARDVEASILNGRVDRSLRLVTTRTIAGEKMRRAFEKDVRPRFLQARTERGLAGTDADWGTFASFFGMERLEEGTVLLFSCDDRTLQSSLDGAALPAIESEALCHALLDVYVGADPVDRELKEDLLSRLEQPLEGGSR